MSQYNSNSSYNKVSVNTNSLTLFDENSTMMKIAFFNETYSITLCTPTTSIEGKKSYPAESRVSFVLPADRVSALYQNIIMDKIIPNINNDNDYNGGVFLSNKRDRIFEIRIQDKVIYAIYYHNINLERKPEKTYIFKFAKTPIIEKYNPETGQFEMPDTDAQFLLFVKTLEGFLLCVNGITTHSLRYTNKFVTDKMFKYFEDIAVKLGISITPSQNPFNESSQSSISDESTPQMVETDDLSNLLMH